MKVSITPQTGAIEIEVDSAKEWALAMERVGELAALSKAMFPEVKNIPAARAAQPAARVSGSSNVKGRIREVLENARAPMKSAHIARMAGLDGPTTCNNAWAMEREGTLVKTAKGVYSLPEHAESETLADDGSEAGGEARPELDIDTDFLGEAGNEDEG